jgi:hypothetical protein
MPKKRKTREQKIISQLRRELSAKQETYTYQGSDNLKIEKPAKVENKLYTYDQSLIKRDIIKSLVLAIICFAIIAGADTTLKFFRL